MALRCPTCGRFYSDSGLPTDYPNREAFALELHRDVFNCPKTVKGRRPKPALRTARQTFRDQ